MPAHKKALLRRTDDCIHSCRFANAGSFLRFILPKAADEGRRTAFCGRQRGLRPTLTVARCPAERADKTADFSKKAWPPFLILSAFSKSKRAGSRFSASPAFSKDGQDCRRRRIGHAVYSEQTVPAGFAVFAKIYAFSLSLSIPLLTWTSIYRQHILFPSLTASLKTPSILNPAFKYTFFGARIKGVNIQFQTMQLFKGKVAGDFCCPCTDSFASFRLLINADSEICTAQFPIHFIDDAFTDYFPVGSNHQKEISVIVF